jgi:hypothetical protein
MDFAVGSSYSLGTKAVKWPRSEDRRAWLVCTAAWGLALKPGDSDRCFVHFALEKLGESGHRREVARISRALLQSSGDFEELVEDSKATALAALGLGDTALADTCLSRASAASRTPDELTGSITDFRKEHGVLSAIDFEALTRKQRVIAHSNRASFALKRKDLEVARRETRAAAQLVTGNDDWHQNVVKLFIRLKNRKAAQALWHRLPDRAKREYDFAELTDLGFTEQALQRRHKSLSAATRAA